MKKIVYILTIILVLFETSCSDSFIDLSPESSLNEKTFYQTEDHFEQAVVGVYEALRATTGRAGFLMAEQRSDNAHYIPNLVDRGQRPAEEIADFTDDAINGHTDVFYRDCFSGIGKANAILDRIKEKSFSAEFTNKIVGQTRFLRAYFYFELVRFYGGVPLMLEEIKVPDKSYKARATVDEVYLAIIDDLNDAIAKLDNPVFNKDNKQSGRVSKGSARMLLAQVMMTKPTRDYAKAESLLKEIMTMGYDLLPNYNDVFDTQHKNSIESLFEVQYKAGDDGQQSDYIYRMMPLTKNGAAITGVAGSNNSSNGGYVIPTQEMVDSYEVGDKRLDVSIAVAVGKIDNTTNIMDISAVLPVGDPAIKNYPSFSYFVNKYRHPHAKVNNTNDNWPIYRYSDVLLSLAECLVQQNRAGEALPYVNKVRTRAGLKDIATVTADVVANERRHELAFENKRWHDLVRTGKAISVMNAYGVVMKQLHPDIVKYAYNVTQDKLIYPIPNREMQLNSLLIQNTGY